jgi:UDP-glucose 4-epimerase
VTRTLVTGGAGFIGSHLVRELLEQGHEVVVLDNLHRGSRDAVPADARLIEGDIRDPSSVAGAVVGCETVLHLAAQSNVLGAVRDVDYSFTTNVAGTFEVLRAAAAAGVARLVFASSREVYGEQAVVPVPECAPMTARNPYGASKIAGEAYCRTWSTLAPLDVSVLRLANVYGPGDRDRVIPLWLDRAARGEDLVVYGGRQVLDFVHVDTVVEAMVAAARRPLDGPVNVGSGKGTPLLALVDRIRSLAGRCTGVIVEPARDAEVVRYVADVTRMNTVLGIERPTDPLSGLTALWESARIAA